MLLNRYFAVLFFLSFGLFQPSCTSLPQKARTSPPPSSTKKVYRPLFRLLETGEPYISDRVSVNEYILDVDDELSIKYYFHPELNETILIRPDGRISLMLAEEIMARGVSLRQLDNILTKKYRDILSKPEVTVILKKYGKKFVYVSGEVPINGEIEFGPNLTILSAVTKAGGVMRTGDKSQVIVIRRDKENKPFIVSIDYKRLLKSPNNYFFLRPYDVIYVPKTTIASVNLFVDQYFNKIFPEALRVGFNFVYDLNPVSNRRNVFTTE